jgi:hypothetical protein
MSIGLEASGAAHALAAITADLDALDVNAAKTIAIVPASAHPLFRFITMAIS